MGLNLPSPFPPGLQYTLIERHSQTDLKWRLNCLLYKFSQLSSLTGQAKAAKCTEFQAVSVERVAFRQPILPVTCVRQWIQWKVHHDSSLAS